MRITEINILINFKWSEQLLNCIHILVVCILDDYLFVYLPGHFIHMLDLGIGHQPCCHIMLPHRAESTEHWFAIKTSTSSPTLLNMKTLQTYTLDISYQLLLDFFYDPNIGLYNKLSIIHYILVHMQEFDIICQVNK